MKRFLTSFALVGAMLLGGCAATSALPGAATKTPAQQAQATWYVYCAVYENNQGTILANIPKVSISTVKTVAPILDKVAKECEAPMPADSQIAATELSGDVTTILVNLGMQKLLPQQGAVK